MNARERLLALVAVIMIFLVGGGVLGYQFYLRPIKNVETRIKSVRKELDDDERLLEDLKNAKPRLEQLKKLSLPNPVHFAQSEYSTELSKMLRDSYFTTGSYSVIPKKVGEQTNVPLSKRKPYTALIFDVSAHGDLASLVDFLDRFYRTPLLHRIRTMGIVRPITAGPTTLAAQQRADDLDITLSIEALIVDGAETRTKLLPANFEKPQKLARLAGQYANIAGRNIFFGPPPATSRPAAIGTDEDNAFKAIWLDGIWHNENGVFASLYDAWNNRKYEIEGKADGSYFVKCFRYSTDRRDGQEKKEVIFGKSGKKLELLGDREEVLDTYNVVHIGGTDLILEYDGQYYRMHAGWRVSDIAEISAAEAKALGLLLKDAKPDDKKAKKDDKKPVLKDDGK